MPFIYRISSGGMLSIPILRQALHVVVMKYESLRTSLIFDTEKDMLMQQIHESCDDNNQLFTFLESYFETEEELNNIIYDERSCPTYFDLSCGLVFRCHVVHKRKFVPNDQLHEGDAIIFNFHHAVFDVPSMNIFLNNLSKSYLNEEPLSDDSNCLRYIDYAVAEREMLMTAASSFWLQTVHDCDIDRPVSLPFDQHHTADEHRTGRVTSFSFILDDDLSQAILTYASTTDTELQHLYLAIYYAFLFKLTNGERNLCVAINTHNRYKDELCSIIGNFSNVIPLRYRIDSCSSFALLVENVRLMVTRAFEYSYFPLQRIFAQHPLSSTFAFLNTSFAFDSNSDQLNNDSVKIGDVSLHRTYFPTKTGADETASMFDFSLMVQRDTITNKMSIIIHASLDLFDTDTVGKFSQRFLLLLKQLFKTSIIDRPIYELSVILPDEMVLIRSLNNPKVTASPFTCVHHEFGRRVSEHSQKVALTLDEQSMTYAELLFNAQHVASYLGDCQGQIICQCVERSIEMIIGQMAILFSGAAYCGLSPEDPLERLSILIKQTGAQFVLIHASTRSKFREAIDLRICDILSIIFENDVHWQTKDEMNTIFSIIRADNLAYLVFTSGSTGTPKLVQITHKNLVACITSFSQHIGIFTQHDIFIQYAQCSFDVHIRECLGTLMIGGSLVLLHPQGNLDLEYFSLTLFRHNVTYFAGVPSFISFLCDYLEKVQQLGRLARIKVLTFGGEAIVSKAFGKIVSHLDLSTVTFYNLYGPAECTIGCIYYQFKPNEVEQGRIPIGTLFPNMRAQILDEFHQFVIPGMSGELFLDGTQRFRGYFGRNDLTDQAFYETFYRTGDVVQMDIKGRIHYIGRKDHQIKLRGQRIELGEIEHCLLEASSHITRCVVVKWSDDHLVAYVQGFDVDEEQLRKHCHSRLPAFMVPSAFI
ncbi:unnamed protein product [Rotaria sp. Silwood2]|nr:unnamed protein product [Rotaria sp. Silwood2]